MSIQQALLRNSLDFCEFIVWVEENMNLHAALSTVKPPKVYPSVVCWENESEYEEHIDHVYVSPTDFYNQRSNPWD